MKTVAIIQSNYIPWIGYFNIIRNVDHFVLLDDVQFTRRDWRNRNQILTSQGLKWLTIPVNVKGNFTIKIHEVLTSDSTWRISHWNALTNAYQKLSCFSLFENLFRDLYLSCEESNLSAINFRFISSINSILNIDTPISWSMDYEGCPTEKNERLLHICERLQADTYVSGKLAQSYLDVKKFEEAGVSVKWISYPDYSALNPMTGFVAGVSVLDTIFRFGYDAKSLFVEHLWE